MHHLFGINLIFLIALSGAVSFPSTVSTVHNIYGNVYDGVGNPIPNITVNSYVDGTLRASSQATFINPWNPSFYLLDVNGLTSEAGKNVTFHVAGGTINESLSFTPLSSSNVNLVVDDYVYSNRAQSSFSMRLTGGWNLMSLPLTQ